MTYTVQLDNIEDIQKLSEIASEQPFEINVSKGCVTINAKSLLALFTLIGEKVNLVAPDHADPQQFIEAVKKMGFK